MAVDKKTIFAKPRIYSEWCHSESCKIQIHRNLIYVIDPYLIAHIQNYAKEYRCVENTTNYSEALNFDSLSERP